LNFFKASKFDLKFSLPSVFLALDKEGLCRVSKKTLGKEDSLLSAKKTLLALGKESTLLSVFCRVFFFWPSAKKLFVDCLEKKYSANH